MNICDEFITPKIDFQFEQGKFYLLEVQKQQTKTYFFYYSVVV